MDLISPSAGIYFEVLMITYLGPFKYRIILTWSTEDGGYIAVVPGLRGLSAFGETPEKAVRELQAAAELYFDVLQKDGKDIP